MKLIHLANFNSTNIGNGALIYGAQRVLQEDLKDISFVPEAWDDYNFTKKFDQGFVDIVNGSDGLLVGGAVTFNGRPYLSNSGMRIDLPPDLMKKIKKPMIFYGVSYKFWPNQVYHHLDKMKKTMEYLLSAPNVFFGVRNDGMKSWLENMIGYPSDKIVVVPDPAVYVPAEDNDYPEISKNRPNLIVSLNNEDEVYRYGGKFREAAWPSLTKLVDEKLLLANWKYVPGWQAEKRRFMKSLAAAIERLAKEFDLNIILAPHYFDDYRTMSELVPFLGPRTLHQRMISSGLLRVPQTPYFYGRYAKADLALSMRVHSMSPSIGLGTPVVPLVSQSRMSEFLEDIGLSDIGVDIHDVDLAEKVYQRAAGMLKDKSGTVKRLVAVREGMRARTAVANKQIAALLS
ncbi:MAG: polysaccharide pyruvyl transferase family protein [bacterium]|nr:polysaccharide pyruvyl transferase family protein [bacterium]